MTNARAAVPCLLLSGLVSACTIDVYGNQAVVTEERRFTAQPGVELVVRSFDGSIDVQGWDANEVAIRIERHAATRRDAEALEVRSSQEGNRIVIEAVRPSRRGRPDGDVSFVVRAPRRATVQAHTTDGAIHASGFEGSVRIETADGSVRAERVSGDVRVRTGDGAIDVQDAAGALDVESGDGSIQLTGRLDSLRAHSGDGRMYINVADGSVVKDRWSVTTGDGSVTLRVPESLDAEIQAESGDGRIRADWPNERPARDDDDDSDSYLARLGAGGQVIVLRSGDGAIEVRRR